MKISSKPKLHLKHKDAGQDWVYCIFHRSLWFIVEGSAWCQPPLRLITYTQKHASTKTWLSRVWPLEVPRILRSQTQQYHFTAPLISQGPVPRQEVALTPSALKSTRLKLQFRPAERWSLQEGRQERGCWYKPCRFLSKCVCVTERDMRDGKQQVTTDTMHH